MSYKNIQGCFKVFYPPDYLRLIVVWKIVQIPLIKNVPVALNSWVCIYCMCTLLGNSSGTVLSTVYLYLLMFFVLLNGNVDFISAILKVKWVHVILMQYSIINSCLWINRVCISYSQAYGPSSIQRIYTDKNKLKL